MTGIQPRRVALTTLGCKVNHFESEVIAQTLKAKDWQVVSADESADLYVINTCTVTAEADRQARQAVRRVVRRNPAARVVVTGCYAQMDPDACRAIPGVDLVLGNDRKLALDTLLPDLEADALEPVLVGDLDRGVSLPERLVDGFRDRTRAFVQVQQGCDQGCTFCIIHQARGPSRSLPATHIRRQVEHLVRSGSREVVLCGVDLGAWGADLPGTSMDLAVLVASLCELPGDYRLRLSSLDPAHLSDALISQFASQPRLCPHLHLSLQSGNTLILKRMKRRYTAEQALERVARIRAAVPGLVLGADIMVGFPTEDDAAFADTEALMAAMYIAYPHVFAYSDRPGTPAARIPRQVPHRVRRFRAARLRRQAVGLRERLVATRIGCAARVLVEDTGGAPAGYRRARSADYLEAWVPEEFAAGRWLDVIYTGRCGEGLIARPKP